MVPGWNYKNAKNVVAGFPTHDGKGNDECLFCSKYTGYDIEKKGAVLLGAPPV